MIKTTPANFELHADLEPDTDTVMKNEKSHVQEFCGTTTVFFYFDEFLMGYV
jgi:transketolase